MGRKLLLGLILGWLLFVLLGCHTMEGLKEDVTFIGDKAAEIIDKEEN